MNNKIYTKEKKKAGQNWGKPRKFEQEKGSRRLRKQAKQEIKSMLDKLTPYNLYLDDVRSPPQDRDWIVVRSYDEFVSVIQERGAPEFVSFDHDLGELELANDLPEPKTGYDCARWMIMNDIPIKAYRVHSMNPVGAQRIRNLIEDYHRTGVFIYKPGK